MKIARLLWKLIWYRPLSYASLPLFMLICYCERLIFGLVVQAFFNALPTQTRLTPGFFVLFVPWLIAIAVRLLLAYVDAFASARFDFDVNALLQYNLFRHILKRPGARGLPGSVGEAINHFRDDINIVVEQLSNYGYATALLVYSAVAFVILLRVNVAITLFVFFPLSCILVVVQRVLKKLETYRVASRTATSNVSGAIGEIFGAVQAIQVAGAEQHVLAHFETLNNKRRRSMVRDQVLSGSLDAFFDNVTEIGTALILLLAALSASDGQLRPGDLVLFITYLGLVTGFFSEMGRLLVQQKQTGISFERLAALLQGVAADELVAHHELYLHRPMPDLPVPCPEEVEKLEMLDVRKLGYRYPETGRGISGIDLHIRRGMLTVVTGRIGAGKTTLLQTLLGLLPKDEGEIYWNGQLIADAAAFFVPPRCAYTAQVPHLFSETLRENILLGLSDQASDVAGAIKAAVLETDIASLPQGLETQIGAKGVRLSGGQIQRTAAARMLVRTPDLLVCDDLSSALDVETEQTLWERLFVENTSYTCIVASNRRFLLQRADQVVVLKDGYVEALGPLETVVAGSEEMHYLWQCQSEQ